MADIDWDELMEEAEEEEREEEREHSANDVAIASALHADEVKAADEATAVALTNDEAIAQVIKADMQEEEEEEEEEEDQMDEDEDNDD